MVRVYHPSTYLRLHAKRANFTVFWGTPRAVHICTCCMSPQINLQVMLWGKKKISLGLERNGTKASATSESFNAALCCSSNLSGYELYLVLTGTKVFHLESGTRGV